jgi:hypothetical protein
MITRVLWTWGIADAGTPPDPDPDPGPSTSLGWVHQGEWAASGWVQKPLARILWAEAGRADDDPDQS